MLTSKHKRQQAIENKQGRMGTCIKVCRRIQEGIYKAQRIPSSSISQWLEYRFSPYYQGTISEYLSRVPMRFIKESS